LTAAGAALGLTLNDINGNASHNIFGSSGGLTVVDRDASGNIVSLDFQGTFSIPEPSSLLMAATAATFALAAWRRHRRQPRIDHPTQ
jgi:hypothetical protein